MTGAAAAAGAVPEDPPQSGDQLATAYPGNVVTCVEAGLAGGAISVTATVGDTYITVTAVPAGTTVTGIVVKGGPAYNTYLPTGLGALPWSNLHPPLVPSGNPAGISHWFACGQQQTTTTTTASTTKTTTATTTATGTTTTPPTKTTTTTSATTTTGTSTAVTTETTTAASTTTTTATGSDSLAYTGFSGGWLAALAAALLIGGVGLVLVPKLLAHRRR
ncbi:hypothetical protein GCM10010174_31050 [Kutzneria viridogrisea]